MKVRKRTWTTSAGKRRSAWFMDYTDPLTGERRRETIPAARDKADAQDFAEDLYRGKVRAARLGEAAGPTESERALTLSQLFDWDAKRPGVRPRTLKSEACHRKPLEQILGAGTPVLAITTAEVERFKSERERAGRKPRTINLGLELLRAALNRARRERLISRIPCEIKKLPETPPEIRFLSPGEVRQLIDACGDIQDGKLRDVVTLLAYLGLRPCDLWRLTWRDMDMVNRIAWANTYKRGATGGIRRCPLPMSPEVYETLSRIREKAAQNGSFDPAGVILHDEGLKCLGRSVKAAAKRAGISDHTRVTPYTLRHSFATNLLQSGATVKDTQMLLRHSNPALTLSRYCHESMPAMRAAVERLAAVTVPEPPSQEGKGAEKAQDPTK